VHSTRTRVFYAIWGDVKDGGWKLIPSLMHETDAAYDASTVI